MQVGVLVLVLVAAALIVALMMTAARRERPERTPLPHRPAPTPVDRRRFLNRAMLGSLSVFAVATGAGSAAFIWPQVRRGSYGGKIVAGRLDALLYELDLTERPTYNVEGRFYLTRYDGDAPELYARAGVLAGGILAISQKCSHLGCRVPYCPTSGWFECPCHGARFNAAGEVMRGPAPASLWHYPIEIVEDEVVVDTSRRVAQTPWGYDSIGTPPAGPFCLED
jgi:cytochrome b6-f complex iron-sulfur subunit